MTTKTKVKSTKKAELTKHNISKMEKEITNQKDLKYNYSKDQNDLPSRKAFRSEARRTINGIEKKLEKLKAHRDKESLEAKEDLNKQLDKARAKYLVA